jgi:hypothetical protein
MRLSLSDAVEFVLSRLEIRSSETRATRDKVRHRLIYALGNGSLPRIDLLTTDVDRNELILFARKKWPGRFNQDKTVQHAGCSDSANLSDRLTVQEYPADVAKCHELIRKQNATLRLLVIRARATDELIEQWRPMVKQYELNCAKNRESARKPRDGRL